MKKYKNIPETGFKSVNVNHSERRAIVKLFESGSITMSIFSLTQLTLGARHHIQSLSCDMIHKSIVELYMRLSENLFTNSPESSLDLTNDDLKLLKLFIEERMIHCEKERDERSERFNPDTYIAQKLLLLDIRELLLGEVIRLI